MKPAPLVESGPSDSRHPSRATFATQARPPLDAAAIGGLRQVLAQTDHRLAGLEHHLADLGLRAEAAVVRNIREGLAR